MKINLQILFILLFLYSLKAQNYIWPTTASTYMSSSFCEFREGHYHSAIDIKTWLKEGYPCYAIDDGYIERIRISPFGYGKVIYLRLEDGNSAVYAHLQKFSEKIEKLIRKMQLNNQKYRIDWKPKNIKIPTQIGTPICTIKIPQISAPIPAIAPIDRSGCRTIKEYAIPTIIIP